MTYRHPVQGWTIPLPVEDTENAPEVFYVKGARLERADLQEPRREEALALLVGRALQRAGQPGAWELLRTDERETWLARGRIAVEALQENGALQ